MKPSLSLAIVASLVFLLTDALVLEKRDNPAVVSLPLQKVTGRPASRIEQDKRSVGTTLNNEGFLWTVTLKIGTPPQTVRVQLDTGSSDLVVETDSSNICASQPNVCSGRGAYDANSSSTYQYLNSQFSTAYGGGDSATGDFASDIVSIGSAVIQNLQFGIMYQTTVVEGILGVSFPAIEASATDYGAEYANLPVLLVQQGYIQSAAFSVWLNDDEGTAGSVLFGGVDTDKFYGKLVTLPFVTGPDDTYVRQCYVTLQGVQMTGNSGNKITLNGGSTPGPALLDTGTSFVYLPPAIAQSIYTNLNAIESGGSYFVLCTLTMSKITVDFIFSGITIHVSLGQLIYDPPGGPTYTYCELGVVSSSTYTILGDTFLSSIYAIFDLDNKEANIAPAVFGSNSQNIYEIGKGPNAVPNVSGQPTTTTSSSRSTISTTSSSTTSTTSSSSSTTSKSSPGSTTSTSSSASSTKTVTTSTTTTTCISSSTSTSSSSTTSTTFTTLKTTTTTTSKTSTTAKPSQCVHDNCYRAIISASATSFCSGYLAGVAQTALTIPTVISKGCSGTASRISSGCSCLQTGG